jgi:hypothetical protein
MRGKLFAPLPIDKNTILMQKSFLRHWDTGSKLFTAPLPIIA